MLQVWRVETSKRVTCGNGLVLRFSIKFSVELYIIIRIEELKYSIFTSNDVIYVVCCGQIVLDNWTKTDLKSCHNKSDLFD